MNPFARSRLALVAAILGLSAWAGAAELEAPAPRPILSPVVAPPALPVQLEAANANGLAPEAAQAAAQNVGWLIAGGQAQTQPAAAAREPVAAQAQAGSSEAALPELERSGPADERRVAAEPPAPPARPVAGTRRRRLAAVATGIALALSLLLSYGAMIYGVSHLVAGWESQLQQSARQPDDDFGF